MEKPILFNTEMVQAILEGRKTTTRRIIKDVNGLEFIGVGVEPKEIENTAAFGHGNLENIVDAKIEKYVKASYMPGDILYVRETWLAHSRGLNTLAFKYKADDAINECVSFTKERFEKFYKFADVEHWQPSLFMPKEAARIFLKITDVRVERLQDITEDQIKKEGIKEEFPPLAQDEFRELWDSTLKKDNLKMYSWDVNPYTWVIEFEVI